MALDFFLPPFLFFFFPAFLYRFAALSISSHFFFLAFLFLFRFSGRRKTEKFLSRSATCDVRIYFVLMKQQQRTVLPVLLVGHCMCNIIVDHENIWHFPSKKKTEREACAFCFCFPLAFHNNAKPISFVFSKNLHMPNQWFVQICRPAHKKKHLPRKGHIRF